MTGSLGRLRKPFQSQRCWSPVSLVMVSSQSCRSMLGVGPADRAGEVLDQVVARRQLSAGRRRPLNPRDTVPISLAPFMIAMSSAPTRVASGAAGADKTGSGG